VNQSKSVYFTESYNVVTLECWGFILTSSATCDEEATRDSYHNQLDAIKIDIFPADISGYLRGTWINGSYQPDRDNDGIVDTDDRVNTRADFDQDGLSDLFERQNGSSEASADGDADGLSDYWEAFYGTDARNSDTDGDGVSDADEFPRPQTVNPFEDDPGNWTGGWTITYDYDVNDDPIETWVWADPLEADADDDSLLDDHEETYGYNPNIANLFNPLSIVTDIETLSAQPGIVGQDDPIVYTATVQNDDNFNSLAGALNVEVPVDVIRETQTISTLLPAESQTLNGSVSAGSVTETTFTSVLMRAETILGGFTEDETQAALLYYPLDEGLTSGAFANAGTLAANSALCNSSIDPKSGAGGCPIAGDRGQVAGGLNFDTRFAVEAELPYTSELNVDLLTLGLWVNRYANGGERLLIGRDNYALRQSGSQIEFLIQGEDGGSCGTATELLSSSTLKRHQWTHVMATYDGSTMRLYINGQLNNSTNHGTGVCDDLSSPFNIGDASSGDQFKGLMDEVLLFDAALSDAEVEEIYNAQFYYFEAEQERPITIDVVAPESELRLAQDLPNSPVILEITSVDDVSRVSEVTVTITSPSTAVETIAAERDMGAETAWLFMFTPDVEGEYSVVIESADAVGNVGTDPATIYVDDSPPEGAVDSALTSSILTVNPDSLADPRLLPLNGTTSDNRTLIDTITIDVQDWLSRSVAGPEITAVLTSTDQAGTWEVDYPFPARAYGRYGVEATMEDFVGNTITETIGTLELDDYGPWADIVFDQTDISTAANTLSGTVNETRYDTSGRILHFHLDEAGGATQFIDATQDKYAATCAGGSCPTAGLSGQYGSAVQFDGSDDLLSVGSKIAPIATDQAVLSETFAISETTLSAWIYPTWTSGGNGYNPTILAVDDGTNTNFRWQIADDYSAMLLVTPGGTESVPVSMTPNQWTHLALVLDNNNWTGYVNGASTAGITQTLGLTPDLPLNIGASNSGEGFFSGLIDEVVVYGHPLSLDEVYDIANPLSTTITSLEIQARHLNGAIWPDVDPDGLQIYLALDDQLGTVDIEYTSLLTQSVSCDDGNGGCPTFGLDGAFKTAAAFDGNAYIEIPDSSELDFQEMSVSFWVKVDADSFNDNLVTKGRDSWEINMHPIQGDGRIIFDTPGLVDAGDSSVTILDSTVAVTDNQWHHVVAIYDGSEKKFYIDGSLAGSQAVIGSLPDGDKPLVIGANYEVFDISVADALNGGLDEVAIFDRALTEDEILELYTYETWQAVTLDAPNSFYSTWSASLPSGLEGLYKIGLRAVDSGGNLQVNPDAWTGPIDLRGPRLNLVHKYLSNGFNQVYCGATDLNMSDDGWSCEAGDPVAETLQGSDWYVDFFSPATRTYGLESSSATIQTSDTSTTFTACDLHGNCTTETVDVTQDPEGIAVLSPINGGQLENYEPVEISGVAWSDQFLRQISVRVNGTTIDNILYSYSSQQEYAEWSVDWTPEEGVTQFEIDVFLLTGEYAGGDFDALPTGVFTDQAETIIEGPSLRIDKSVSPELAFSGEVVTYTVVVANNGLRKLEDVTILDTLPSGVSPTGATTGISDTVDLAVGEAVTYTIPVAITAAQGSIITNTVSVEHVTFNSSEEAVLSVCSDALSIINGNSSGSGSLPWAFDNLCEGGTIT
ncbi:MAG: LamG-like jellyroll fold domain-containing protein, partial [Chloroflexota bacterium]